MRVIARPRLREFWEKHNTAEEPLKAWWKIAEKANWKSIQDVRKFLPHADAVTLKCGNVITVFNVKGGRFRLLTAIVYEYGTVYIKQVLTHEEYDSNKWKVQLCRE